MTYGRVIGMFPTRHRRLTSLILRLSAALVLLGALLPAGQPLGIVVPAFAADAKIDPWVLAHDRAASVEFLVVLSQQADLSGRRW